MSIWNYIVLCSAWGSAISFMGLVMLIVSEWRDAKLQRREEFWEKVNEHQRVYETARRESEERINDFRERMGSRASFAERTTNGEEE